MDCDGLISLVLNIFLEDFEPLCDLITLVAAFEDRIRNADATQGISINRPSDWTDLLLITSQLPIADAFSQLLRCIRDCTAEPVLELLHLSSQRDLPRLHRLQSALVEALPAAMRSDVFRQSLEDFFDQELPVHGGAMRPQWSIEEVHRILHSLIRSLPDDWYEFFILAAICAVDDKEAADLLAIIAPFDDKFQSELPTLRQQLDNPKSSPEFQLALSAVSDHSDRWFGRNGLRFDPDTLRLSPAADPQPSPPQSPVPGGVALRGNRQPRDYQLELAEPALSGRNSIVIAPTSSGKTLVAVYVTLQLLEAEPGAKVAFLASTTQLVQQQYEEFRTCLPDPWRDRVCQIHGGIEKGSRLPFAQALKRHSVLVLSTKILVNALLDRKSDSFGGKGIAAFRLIVFDECHHCKDSDVAMEVMLNYLRLKKILEQQGDGGQSMRLPQILGLTASPGTGKASRSDQANEHVIKLCANLNCPYPVTVQRYLRSLAENTPDLVCEIHSVPGKSSSDGFIGLLNTLMHRGEELLRAYCEDLPQPECEGLPSASVPHRGIPAYIGYCASIKYGVHNVLDPAASKNLLACSRYLGSCNEALMIAQYFRSVDALCYLQEELRSDDEMAKPAASEAEERLRRHLDELMGPLTRFCATDEALSSPPLDKLMALLRDQFFGRPDSRAIVYVERKSYAVVLAEILNGTASGASALGLAATYVTGATSGEASGGTNANEQRAKLKDFRDGKYKVIASTSVTEEGLDIPACNLVVRYCHLTNEISRMQAMGRCRAENGAYHVIVAETQDWLREKERTNQERSAMMGRAVECVTNLQSDDLVVRMREYQDLLLSKDDGGTSGGAAVSSGSNMDSDHDILCGKCFTLLSHSTRLRLIGKIHRIVMDVDMFAGSLLRGQSGESKKVPGLEIPGIDLVCNECGAKVAKVVRHGRLFFPLPTLGNIRFRRSHTGEPERLARQWTQTEVFLRPVGQLTQEDKDNWRRQVPRLPERLWPAK